MSGMKKGTESGRKTRERLSDRDRDRERDGATQRKRGFHPGVSPLFLKHGSHITQITQSGKPHTPHACVFFFLLRNISEYVTSQLDSSVVFRRVERVYRHGNVWSTITLNAHDSEGEELSAEKRDAGQVSLCLNQLCSGASFLKIFFYLCVDHTSLSASWMNEPLSGNCAPVEVVMMMWREIKRVESVHEQFFLMVRLEVVFLKGSDSDVVICQEKAAPSDTENNDCGEVL